MPNNITNQKISAVIYGVEGIELSPREKSFFGDNNPLGFILFSRNIQNPEQVATLVRDLRDSVGRNDAPVLLDQEGGRVARLKEPHWPKMPSFQQLGDIASEGNYRLAIQAVQLHAELMADMFHSVGATVNCSPVLDVLRDETHGVIGDRAFGNDPFLVARLGHVYAETLMENGVTPIMKHIPGHGRARADSHFELPVVDTDLATLYNKDFYPFRCLSETMGRDLWAMTAHVLYSDLDTQNPATTSKSIVSQTIRKDIGFDGFIVADDISMNALKGTLPERCVCAIEAGCDAVLHCNGRYDEMVEIAKVMPSLSADAHRRFTEAEQSRCSGTYAGRKLSAEERRDKYDRLYALVRSDEFCVWHPRHSFLNQ